MNAFTPKTSIITNLSSHLFSQTSPRRKRRDSTPDKYGNPRAYDPDFRGPITKDRGCTDCICAILFIVFLGGWVAVAVFGFANGNPMRIVHPSDSSGDICGRGDYADKPYILFFDLSRCLLRPDALIAGCPTKQVCVEKCPDEFSFPWADGVVGSVQEEKVKKANMSRYCGPKMTQAVIDDDSVTMKSLISSHVCPPWVLPSKALFQRCVPIFGAGSGSTAEGADQELGGRDHRGGEGGHC